MGRNRLAHHAGNVIEGMLAAVGYNFRLLVGMAEIPSARRPLAAHMAPFRFQIA
jgi:hypothetical protein